MMRIQKFISACGALSRRAAEQAILDGRVRVNDQLLENLGTLVEPEKDRVELDGVTLSIPSRKELFLFHKPRRVMTTKSDPEGRRTWVDLLPDAKSLNSAGRLDFDSEGLLVLTNDGELLDRLTHPRYQIEKEYRVRVDRPLLQKQRSRLLQGIELEDGIGKFASIRDTKNPLVVNVIVTEGRNRFVRRMFEAVDLKVQRLLRTRMGPFSLDRLKPGEKKSLAPSRITELRESLFLTRD